MNFEMTGNIIEKFDIQQITETFRKREFVVETVESHNGKEFREQIKFQLTQDRCQIVDQVEINDEINVKFNIKGRRWEKNGNVNYFNNLEAWRVEKISGTDSAPLPSDDDYQLPAEDEDDLVPF